MATWFEKPKTSWYHLIKVGRLSVSRVIANDVDGVGLMRIKSRGRVDHRFARDRRFAAGLVRESNGSVKLERYSHEGYLIKVVIMTLAGEVARELSPIRSWSNNNYDLKLGEKARGQELHIRSAVDVVMI